MRTDGPSDDRQSLQYVLRSGLAGGVAGCVAKTVVAPLDRVKILFQASNPDFQKYAGTWSGAFRAVSLIYREHGVRGLLQGHSATLLRIFPYAAINFMTYDQAEALLMPTPETQTNARRFAAGAISGHSLLIGGVSGRQDSEAGADGNESRGGCCYGSSVSHRGCGDGQGSLSSIRLGRQAGR